MQAPTPNGPDQRKFRRLLVEGVTARVVLECRLIDLSIGGALVRIDRPLPSGTALTLEIPLDDGEAEPVRATARVEWIGDLGPSGGGVPASMGMGVSFVAMRSADDRVRIARFLRRSYDVTRRLTSVATDLPCRFRTGPETAADDGAAAKGGPAPGTPLPGRVRELGERLVFVESETIPPSDAPVAIEIDLPAASRPVVIRGRTPPAGEETDLGGSGALRPGRAAVTGFFVEVDEIPFAAKELIAAYMAELRDEERT